LNAFVFVCNVVVAILVNVAAVVVGVFVFGSQFYIRVKLITLLTPFHIILIS